MRTIKKYFHIVITSAVIALSCDRVEQPVPAVQGAINWALYPGDPASYPFPSWPGVTSNKKNILLEDFTGHRCTNCPAAGQIAKDLEDANAGQVIVVSVHASPDGGFQAVVPPEFTTDFKTEAGTTYSSEMPGFVGNPSGTINRKTEPQSNTVWHPSSVWTTTVNNSLNETNVLNLQQAYNYFPETKGLFVHTKAEFLAELSGDYSLITYLIRESVEAPQDMPGGITNHEYHHHSVLTDNINGVWGTQISSGTSTIGTSIENTFTYQLSQPDSTYNINNLALVTYVCNRNTFEVIQVVKTTLD